MNRSRRETGRHWEDTAAQHIEASGLQILARRYYCRLGEIDLIAADGDTIVFVEVRYRSSGKFGGAAASVTRSKQQRILCAARHFIMHNHALAERRMRIDVIAVEGAGNAATARLQWIRDAFGT